MDKPQPPDAPRRDLVRFAPLSAPADAVQEASGVILPEDIELMALRAEETDDDGAERIGTLVGYPIVFNTWTRIDSWFEGTFMERIDPGALDEHLAKRGDRIRVLFNHGMDPSIGNKPLGKPAVQEARAKGLYSEVPLSDTSYNRDLAALIRDGAIDGQSFRFDVLDEDWHYPDRGNKRNPDKLPERTITKMTVPEYGPVTFPAYEAASVGLRTAAEWIAWQHADQELRAAMLAAKGLTNARAVLEQLGDRAVQLGGRTEVTTEERQPPAERDDDSDTLGDPGYRSQEIRERITAAARSLRTRADTAKGSSRYAP